MAITLYNITKIVEFYYTNQKIVYFRLKLINNIHYDKKDNILCICDA